MGDKTVHAFLKLKVNLMAWLEFELPYYMIVWTNNCLYIIIIFTNLKSYNYLEKKAKYCFHHIITHHKNQPTNQQQHHKNSTKFEFPTNLKKTTNALRCEKNVLEEEINDKKNGDIIIVIFCEVGVCWVGEKKHFF